MKWKKVRPGTKIRAFSFVAFFVSFLLGRLGRFCRIYFWTRQSLERPGCFCRMFCFLFFGKTRPFFFCAFCFLFLEDSGRRQSPLAM